ncbi:hypothetical protein [Neobacillus sp. D3-1R]|uniref:hypothetical protein n=1 Tax=Neobacillus sp. D3-1R TaxID=3445778 RepID=UPI003F9FBDDF
MKKTELKQMLETLLQYKESDITLNINGQRIVRFDKESMRFQMTKLENGLTESFLDIATTLVAILKEFNDDFQEAAEI